MARSLKNLTLDDLNPVMFPTSERLSWAMGMLQAANLVNEMYSASTVHLYAIGDCLLAKVNLLKPGKKPRKNPAMYGAIDLAEKQKRDLAKLKHRESKRRVR